MRMEGYGVTIYRNGVVFHADMRKRRTDYEGEPRVVPFWMSQTPFQGEVIDGRYVLPRFFPSERASYRGAIRAFSEASAKRLAFVTANAMNSFRWLLTLTYHGELLEWEDDGARNKRHVERSKEDLNRFLSCMRKELGAYIWVQEFQARGVIHYHLICEGDVSYNRVRLAWLRAIGSLGDTDAFKHGVHMKAVEAQAGALAYLGKYVGKERQKLLPKGVDGAGKWWNRSRGVTLAVLAEVVSADKGSPWSYGPEARVVRALRKYLSREMRRSTLRRLSEEKDPGKRKRLKERLRRGFIGGWFVSWGGQLPAKLAAMIERLQGHYGKSVPMPDELANFGMEEPREGLGA